MKRVLFVDDEPRVLQGFRRMLRSMRKQWAMSFAEGGAAALELLEHEHFDVVVTDMRMPGIDGAAVLEFAQARDPGIARIVLSGQTDREPALRFTGTAHQFLAKPCDAQRLVATVQRVCRLRDLMKDDAIQRVVAGTGSLPSLPEIYRELTAEMQRDDVSLERVATIVSRDVALTAKVLQLVNSAFFGLPGHIEGTDQAVRYLGVEVIRSLCLSEAAFGAFRGDPEEFGLQQLWEHSIAVGARALTLAKSSSTDKLVADAALQAGMLHDVGRVLLAAGMPDAYKASLRLAEGQQIELFEAERSTVGTDHARIGAYLVGLWGLPDSIVEAIAYHHSPESCPSDEYSALDAVAAANADVAAERAGGETAAAVS